MQSLATDWVAVWQGVTAVVTFLLFLATAGLVLMAYQTVGWARQTFGHQDEIEKRRRRPLVSLQFAPAAQGTWNLAVTEDQREAFLKWLNLALKRGTLDYQLNQTVVACFARNIGEGPALKVKIPYTLQISDIAEDGSDLKDEPRRGEIEVMNVDSKSWGFSKVHINTTYYPKCELKLIVDEAVVYDVDMRIIDGAVSIETSDPYIVINNKATWDVLEQMKAQGHPSPTDASGGLQFQQ